MQGFINSFLKIIKYPVALTCAFFTFPLLQALIRLISETFNMHLGIYFLLPIIGTVALWNLIPGLAGASFTIFAHESTHMLAAVLTGHKPVGMKIEQDKGGSFSYLGKGNWLITIAPYFLPTFPFIWMLVGVFFGMQNGQFEPWYIITYGFWVGFHISANFTQIHSEQTDFKKAGWLFTTLFIPGANLFVIGYLWCFALKGWAGLSLWHQYISPACREFFKQILTQIQQMIG